MLVCPVGYQNTWQTRCRERISDKDTPPTQPIYYRIPSGTGATVFLIELANERAALGESVVFVVEYDIHRAVVKEHLDKSIQILNVVKDSHKSVSPEVIKDIAPDWIIGDRVYDMMRDYIPLFTTSRQLYIDTVH